MASRIYGTEGKVIIIALYFSVCLHICNDKVCDLHNEVYGICIFVFISPRRKTSQDSPQCPYIRSVSQPKLKIVFLYNKMYVLIQLLL